MIIYTCTY